MGEVYFRVSQHLNTTFSYVIRNKFNPDVKMLIIKYTSILRAEQEELERMREDMDNL